MTVPGAVRLWEDVAKSLGRLPLSRLLELAREVTWEIFLPDRRAPMAQ